MAAVSLAPMVAADSVAWRPPRWPARTAARGCWRRHDEVAQGCSSTARSCAALEALAQRKDGTGRARAVPTILPFAAPLAALRCARASARRAGRAARRCTADLHSDAVSVIEWLRIPPLIDREACEVPAGADAGGGDGQGNELVTLPVLPLRRVPLPRCNGTLVASERRHRELYDDLLQSGGRRFIGVLLHRGQLARYGVVMHLQGLTEGSSQRTSRRLWVGHHIAGRRARLQCVQNPQAWFDRSTYLRATAELLDGPVGARTAHAPAAASGASAEEREAAEELTRRRVRALRRSLEYVATLQTELGEDMKLQPCRWSELGLWALCSRWREFVEARMQRQCRASIESAVQLWAERCPDGYLTVQRGEGFYPVSVRQEMGLVHEKFSQECSELSLYLQQVLQNPDVGERAEAVQTLVEAELGRLLAMKALADIGAR